MYNMKRFVREIYSCYLKRSRISSLKKRKFGSFGANSDICCPCIMDSNIQNVHIGNNTTIMKGLRMQLFHNGEYCPQINIGDNCYFCYNLSLLCGADINIEKGVLIASDVLISSENHSMDPESEQYYMHQPLQCKPITIGEGCWIGEKCCILAGVNIGKKCIIGAGSIVTKSIPDYSIAVGNPAKVIKKYDFELHEWVKV